MPKVSVIIPVYNAEKTLKKCLDSVVNQTLIDLEIILVDDGSTDESGVICDLCATTDKRIKVIHNCNQGVSYARNCGLEVASGDYIGFVDSDDFISIHMYECMYNKIESTQSDICIVGYNIVGNNGEKKEFCLPWKDVLNTEEIKSSYVPLLIGRNKTQKILGSSCLCLYKRKIIENMRFSKKIKLLEDTLFNISVAIKIQKLCIVDECLYNYCVVENSATNRFRNDALEQIELIISEIKKYEYALKKENINAHNNYVATVFDLVLYVLKNAKKSDSSMKKNERVNYIKMVAKKTYTREMLRCYRPETIKKLIFTCLLKIHAYSILDDLL